jgi:hypothetical protein
MGKPLDKMFLKVNLMKRRDSMLSLKKTLVSCFLLVSLILNPLSALAEKVTPEPSKEEKTQEAMAIDLIAVRPIGIVATLAGAVVFLVSWPFSALGGNSEEAWDTLVADPATYTFQRPLGDFEE